MGVLLSVFALQAQSACTFFDDFQDNKDGTITDPRNNLIWKRCAEGSDWDGSSCNVGASKKDWFEAMATAKGSKFLRKTDWRLPTKSELLLVVGDYANCKSNNYEAYEYAASRKIAHATDSENWPGSFWSSSPADNGDERFATSVYFRHGLIMENGRSTKSNVRLVRSSQSVATGNIVQSIEERKIPIYKKAAEASDEKMRSDRAKHAASICNDIYPGKTGVRSGNSSLSIDVNYVVRYVNKDRGTATIEATSSGQLNMNRGEMKEVACAAL